jgi:UDP-galactopyranose mutase
MKRRRVLAQAVMRTTAPVPKWRRWLWLPMQAIVFLVFLVGIPVAALLRSAVLALVRFVPRRDPESNEFDVIAISHVPWSHIWQRNHHTMTRLARRRKVIYVEDFATTYLHVFTRWLPGSFKVFFMRHPDVVIRHPLLLPGESRFRWMRELNRWLLATNVRWYEWRFGLRNTVLWFYYPGGVYVLERCEPAAVVYDIQDEYSAFIWAPRDISERERELLARADVIFAGTHALYETKCKGVQCPAYFYPCGVEFEHFNAAAPDAELPLAEPKELEGIPHPRLIYMGLIDARIDGQLLAAVAKARPQWQILMLGPVDIGQFKDFSDVVDIPNIHFFGSVAYRRLPCFLAHSEVCIMPWKVNELTRHINPTKTLEYLSTARPVVSIRLPDLENFFGDCVALADTAEEFIEQCEAALAGRHQERIERGLELAQSFSWEKVVGEMEQHVANAIERRRHRAGLSVLSATNAPASTEETPS